MPNTPHALPGCGLEIPWRSQVASGKNICPISFFQTEREILLSPNHKFIVTSQTGGYTQGEYTIIDMMQQEGVWFVS